MMFCSGRVVWVVFFFFFFFGVGPGCGGFLESGPGGWCLRLGSGCVYGLCDCC